MTDEDRASRDDYHLTEERIERERAKCTSGIGAGRAGHINERGREEKEVNPEKDQLGAKERERAWKEPRIKEGRNRFSFSPQRGGGGGFELGTDADGR